MSPPLLSRQRPSIAATVTGLLAPLLVALAGWAVTAVPDTVPSDVVAQLEIVARGLGLLAGGGLGWAAGQIAQRLTWPDQTHRAAVAYALALDGPARDEALEALGITRREAAELIGVDPPDEPPAGETFFAR